jgi:crotonobetainyl-CoA:carnitine CoA-transferase CaiB-like acyl-CoA transferase
LTDRCGPLAGIRVVDFTHILAGPFCTQLLGDAGATIIKIESPTGDNARNRGPRRYSPTGESCASYHAAINRGKQSIILDLKRRDALDVALRLISTADVVVENFSPGTLERLGINLEEIRKAQAGLISVSISLYGKLDPSNPLAKRGGLAVVAEGESSVGRMTRDKDGAPVRLGIPLGDMAAGFAGYSAVLTGLYERERTGLGQHFDISMAQTLFSYNASGVMSAQFTNTDLYDIRTAGYGIYQAADGFVTLGINYDGLFARAMRAIGHEEMIDDPRYARAAERDLLENADAVDELITSWMSQHTVDQIIDTIAPTGVPCGRVATPGDVLANPVLRELGFVQEIGDGVGGRLQTPANPFGYQQPDACLPLLGGQTDEVLADIGIEDAQRAALRESGALGLAKAQPAAATVAPD